MEALFTNGSWSRRSVLGAALGVAAASVVTVPRSATAESLSAQALTTATASGFGFDPVDSTEALQAALDSTADLVIIDNVGADWITRPLFVRRSDVTILIEEGVTLRAKVGGFPLEGDSLLTINAQSGVTVFGYGAEFVMNKAEYTSGEWRMALLLRGVSDTLIEGLTLRDSGGDGVYLGSASFTPNRNVVLRNLVCDNNRRNALSVISADTLLVEGCAFTNSDGTAPRAGVDFEPNKPYERLANIVLRDCLITGNGSVQLVVAPTALDASSVPISILVERVLLDKQAGGSPVLMYYGSGSADPGGVVEVRDSVVRNVTNSGSLGVFRKSASGTQLKVTRTVFWNWQTPFVVYQPITITAGHPGSAADPIPQYGGVTLTDCVLVTNQAPPVIKAVEPTTGSSLRNVHGNLTVVGPQTATADYGANPQNVNLTLTAVPVPGSANALGATVSVRPRGEVAIAGTSIRLMFTRSGGLMSAPLAVQYALEGDAIERFDYNGVCHALVFPAGQSSVTVSIPCLVTGDTGPSKHVLPKLVPNPFYSVSATASDPVYIVQRN